MDDATSYRIRTNLEDAVMQAREAGMTRDEVKEEIDNALDNYDEETQTT